MRDKSTELDYYKTFVVDPNGEYKTKSKDVLHVRYAGLSESHYASDFSTVHVYEVTNKTKARFYFVHFYKTKHEQIRLVDCNCEASKLCKHVCAAVKVHLSAIENGFITET